MGSRENNIHCFISELPIYLLHEIFFRLPFKIILRCKAVSPAWKDLLSEPSFSANYAKNSPFTLLLHCAGRDSDCSFPRIMDMHEISENEDKIGLQIELGLPYGLQRLPYFLVGSINGFLCMRLCLDWYDFFYVYNPILEAGDIGFRMGHNAILEAGWIDDFRFGFSPTTNKFKVLRIIFKSDTDLNLVECEIFTVGVDDKWRPLPNSFAYLPIRYDFVAINGFFHWIRTSKAPNLITTFDLAEEKFGVISVPPSLLLVSGPVDLGVFGNQLGFVDFSVPSQISIWKLKKDLVVESWTKVVILSSWLPSEVLMSHSHLIRVSALQNGDVLLQYSDNYVISCNIEQKKCSKIEVYGVEKLTPYSLLPFVPNFLSPAEWILKGHGNVDESEQKKCSEIEVYGVEKLTSYSISAFAANFLSPAKWILKGHQFLQGLIG